MQLYNLQLNRFVSNGPLDPTHNQQYISLISDSFLKANNTGREAYSGRTITFKQYSSHTLTTKLTFSSKSEISQRNLSELAHLAYNDNTSFIAEHWD